MHYTRDVSDIRALAKQPESPAESADHPSGYLPDRGLVDAVNVALTIGKPLLLTGDPGTGKTQLAHSLAWQLAARKRLNVTSPLVETFETKSTSVAGDLFYTFDAIRRFQAAREARGDSPGSQSNAAFITYRALGRALLRALPPDRVPVQVRSDLTGGPPVRTVVLIDEIDKAPRDFPNDLLNEIEHMYFRIPELDNVTVGGPGIVAPAMRPIVVITSNSEKNLPDPFLRRCIYYHIPFPAAERLGDILLSRVAQLSGVRGPLLDDALEFFHRLRQPNTLERASSPAELIDWLAYMLNQGAKRNAPLKKAGTIALGGLSALTKDYRDQDSVRKELESFLERR